MVSVETILIFLVLGLLSGISNSLIGFGGGFFIVPALYWLLTYFTKLPANDIMKIAIGTTFFIILINSTNAVLRFHKNRMIRWSIGQQYFIPVTLGGLVTLFLAYNLNGIYLKYLFCTYLGMSIILCFRSKFLHPIYEVITIKNAKLYTFGAFAGFSASLLGVGGSVLTVPHFRKRGLKMNESVPLASLLTLPIAIMGLASYGIAGWRYHSTIMNHYMVGYIYLPAAVFITLGANLGLPIGMRLAKRIPDEYYAKAYLAVLCIVFVIMML